MLNNIGNGLSLITLKARGLWIQTQMYIAWAYLSFLWCACTIFNIFSGVTTLLFLFYFFCNFFAVHVILNTNIAIDVCFSFDLLDWKLLLLDDIR